MTWMTDNRTPVHCVQLEEELDWLLGIYRELKPRRVLEIGSHVGGTLWHWMENAEPGAFFAAISLNATEHIPTWRNWAAEKGHTLAAIDADSTTETAVSWMHSFAMYDFIFIDGSHWWEHVSKDWQHAQMMVRPGGIVAFHDITDHGGMPNEQVDVPELWKEITANGHITAEKVALPGVYCGIGVVYL